MDWRERNLFRELLRENLEMLEILRSGIPDKKKIEKISEILEALTKGVEITEVDEG